jgi:hypothetical protein
MDPPRHRMLIELGCVLIDFLLRNPTFGNAMDGFTK